MMGALNEPQILKFTILKIVIFVILGAAGIAMPFFRMIKRGKSRSDRVLGYIGLMGPFLFLLGFLLVIISVVTLELRFFEIGLTIAMVGVVISLSLVPSLWMIKKERPRSDRVLGYIGLMGGFLIVLISLANHEFVLDWLDWVLFGALLMILVSWVRFGFQMSKQIKCKKKRENSRSDQIFGYIVLTGVLSLLLFRLLLRFLPVKHVYGDVLDLFIGVVFLVGLIWIIAATILAPTSPCSNPFVESQSDYDGVEKGDGRNEESE